MTAKSKKLPGIAKSDVLNTYRVWLIYELFRGSITDKELDWSEIQVRDFVMNRKSINPHLCAGVGIAKGNEANDD